MAKDLELKSRVLQADLLRMLQASLMMQKRIARLMLRLLKSKGTKVGFLGPQLHPLYLSKIAKLSTCVLVFLW